jgi:hypothetical protein
MHAMFKILALLLLIGCAMAACIQEPQSPTISIRPAQDRPIVKSTEINLDKDGKLVAWLEVAKSAPNGEYLNLKLKIENRSNANIKAYFHGGTGEVFVSSEQFSASEVRPDPEDPRFVMTGNVVTDIIRFDEWFPGEIVEIDRKWSQYLSVPQYGHGQGPVPPGDYWLDGVIRVVAVGSPADFDADYSPNGSTTKLIGFDPVMFSITSGVDE